MNNTTVMGGTPCPKRRVERKGTGRGQKLCKLAMVASSYEELAAVCRSMGLPAKPQGLNEFDRIHFLLSAERYRVDIGKLLAIRIAKREKSTR
jgi:hypothetical protein